MKRIAVVLVLFTAILALAMYARRDRGGDDGLSASGTVEATEADLGFQTGGRIERVAVSEGDVVQSGAELARLDASELNARLSAADAQIAAASALLSELRRGARPAEAGQAAAVVTAARERMEELQRASSRARTLYEAGAISMAARDEAQTAYDVARAQHDQAVQQATLVRDGPRNERIAAQEAVVQQARAVKQQIAAVLHQSVITAPFSGVISVKHRESGETVAPGLPVVTLLNTGDRWVRIYIPETEMARVRIGQQATITSDTDATEYSGRVTFIASEAEFTPRNVQTPDERVKLVYAVKVAITSDTRGDLKPGMPADVHLLAQRNP